MQWPIPRNQKKEHECGTGKECNQSASKPAVAQSTRAPKDIYIVERGCSSPDKPQRDSEECFYNAEGNVLRHATTQFTAADKAPDLDHDFDATPVLKQEGSSFKPTDANSRSAFVIQGLPSGMKHHHLEAFLSRILTDVPALRSKKLSHQWLKSKGYMIFDFEVCSVLQLLI